MLGREENKVFVADDEPMVCESCTEIPEKEAPLARYAVALNMGKCIGCRMCMIDCAAHHAEAKDGPIVYPRSWDLLPEAGLAVDVDGPCLATCPFALMPAGKALSAISLLARRAGQHFTGAALCRPTAR